MGMSELQDGMSSKRMIKCLALMICLAFLFIVGILAFYNYAKDRKVHLHVTPVRTTSNRRDSCDEHHETEAMMSAHATETKPARKSTAQRLAEAEPRSGSA